MLETRMLTASNRRPCLHHPAAQAEMIGIRDAFTCETDTGVPLIPLSHEVIFAISLHVNMCVPGLRQPRAVQ
jgi:hypothetical protein